MYLSDADVNVVSGARMRGCVKKYGNGKCDTRQKLVSAATGGYGSRLSGYLCLTKTKWSTRGLKCIGFRPDLHSTLSISAQ
jgi:hypothetical protein